MPLGEDWPNNRFQGTFPLRGNAPEPRRVRRAWRVTS